MSIQRFPNNSGGSSGGLQGTWNASTNTPTLSNTDTSKVGYMYQVSTGGSVDFGAGAITFEAKDIVINNGTAWDKIDSSDAVLSVNGNNGVVVLDKTDIGLTNVDNTSDANKPVSTATQTALDGKANSSHTHSASDINSGTLSDARLSTNIRRSIVGSFPVDDNIVPSCVVGLAEVAKTYSLPGALTSAPSCITKVVGLGAQSGQFTVRAEVTATDTVTVYYSYNDNSAGTIDIGEKTVYIENTKA